MTGYAFDHNGNTIVKTDSTGNTSYTWDYENRMTSVILPGSGGAVSFLYDPFGRRIEKVSPTVTSILAYDGDNLVEEVNSSGTAVARYSQGLNIDEPLVMLRGGATSYYEADGLGSVTSLTNAAGTAAQTYTYDSFGNTVATSGSLVNSFQYTGREFDTETSLYYYRARYYDSSSGRFLNEDPSGFGEGSVSLYSYVRNGPTNLIDPFGLSPGDKYANAKCAGWNAVNDYNPTSIAQNKEYGGFIYQNSDGTYSYTDPHVNGDAGIGTDQNLPRFWQIPIPPGTQRAGWYHTHAGGPLTELNNDFSDADKDISDIGLHGLPGFLGTPKPQVRMYIPSPDNPRHGVPFPLSGKTCGCSK